MIISKLIIVFVIFILIIHSCNGNQVKQTVSKSDECYSYIPDDIVGSVYILEPDNGGLRDQIIKSTPQKSRQSKNVNQNEKNTKLYYLLKNLLPNTQYAIRISYPASSPTDYKIQFFDNPIITTDLLNQFIKGEKKKTRDLLNTEIIKFKTDDGGFVIESHQFNILKLNPCSVITIEAINVAITPTFVQNDLYKYQSFDLIMDTELAGVPPEIPKLVLIIIVSIAILLLFLITCSDNIVDSNHNYNYNHNNHSRNHNTIITIPIITAPISHKT